jgi:hypothetical protein
MIAKLGIQPNSESMAHGSQHRRTPICIAHRQTKASLPSALFFRLLEKPLFPLTSQHFLETL